MDTYVFSHTDIENILNSLENRSPFLYDLLVKYDKKYLKHINIEREDEKEYKIARDYLYMLITSYVFMRIANTLNVTNREDLILNSSDAIKTIFKAVINAFCVKLPNHKKKFSEIEYLSKYFIINRKTFESDNISSNNGIIGIKECYLTLLDGYDQYPVWMDIINDRSKVNLIDKFKLARYDFDNILTTLDEGVVTNDIYECERL